MRAATNRELKVMSQNPWPQARCWLLPGSLTEAAQFAWSDLVRLACLLVPVDVRHLKGLEGTSVILVPPNAITQ